VARPDAPSQSQVLRDRSARVPWGRVIREAIRDRTGSGRIALPDRLEGAVYGQLVGDAIGAAASWSASEASPDPTVPGQVGPMLALLASLLEEGSAAEQGLGARAAPRSAPGASVSSDETAPPSPADLLPIPLVRRRRTPAEVVDATLREGGLRGEGLLAGALYALVIHRLMAGERRREGILARATDDLRAALADLEPARLGEAETAPLLVELGAAMARSRGSIADPMAAAFQSGWEAFARADDYVAAVRCACAGSGDHRVAAAIAGGLAGACWGCEGIPDASRRALPEAAVARALVDRLIEREAPGWDGRSWLTSTADPLRVDRLDLSGLDGCAAGAVGITFLPGRRYVGYHTGAHWRDLETDAARLRALGIGVLFLLVEDRELSRCRVTRIGEALAAAGVDLVRFPIRDPLLPRDGVAFRRVVASLLARVRDGGSVAIACRGGLDRAGMAAACLLREAGLGADEAIERVQRARIGALTLPDQQAYVRAWPPVR
jgi:hypothetical protein